MRDRIDQKIKDIESDIEAIRKGEALYLYNEPNPSDVNSHKESAIRFQEWRIMFLQGLKDKSQGELEIKLSSLSSIKNPSFSQMVDIDLYRIALGVM